MPSDLAGDVAALTPPFLVCAVFLIAVGAFLKHELGRAKPSDEDEDSAEVSTKSSAHAESGNLASAGSVSERGDDADIDPTP